MIINGPKLFNFVKKSTQNMRMAKLVPQNHGNILIFKYFGQIYSVAKIFIDFFQGKFIWMFICDLFYLVEYIWIFIRPISMITNTFGYLIVQKNDICPTLGHMSICAATKLQKFSHSPQSLLTTHHWKNGSSKKSTTMMWTF